MKLIRFIASMLFFALVFFQGCTLFEVEPTRATQSQPAAPANDPEADLKAKVADLEKRVKALEEKLEGRW